MPHSASKINAYAKKIDELRRAAVKLPDSTRLAVNAVTEKHRLAIKDIIERRIVDKNIATAEYLPMQAQIQAEVNSMIDEAKRVLSDAQGEAFQLATQKGRELALEAGGTFFSPSSAQLSVAQSFSADLITNLAADTMKEVNSVLSRAALGGVQPYDAMKQIDSIIGIKGAGGVSWRAETIVRTEVGRIYSVALDAQFESFLQSGVDRKKVLKKWVSGPNRPGRREDHQEMDGETVPYDEPFKMPSGNLLMYPGDPAGPPDDVINCGCTFVLVPESIEDAVLSALEAL